MKSPGLVHISVVPCGRLALSLVRTTDCPNPQRVVSQQCLVDERTRPLCSVPPRVGTSSVPFHTRYHGTFVKDRIHIHPSLAGPKTAGFLKGHRRANRLNYE